MTLYKHTVCVLWVMCSTLSYQPTNLCVLDASTQRWSHSSLSSSSSTSSRWFHTAPTWWGNRAAACCCLLLLIRGRSTRGRGTTHSSSSSLFNLQWYSAGWDSFRWWILAPLLRSAAAAFLSLFWLATLHPRLLTGWSLLGQCSGYVYGLARIRLRWLLLPLLTRGLSTELLLLLLAPRSILATGRTSPCRK